MRCLKALKYRHSNATLINIFMMVLICLFVYNCGCNDDGFESFELNSFEKNVIPFTVESTVEFYDNNSDIFNATISKKTTENYNLNASDDESCFTSLVERSECNYTFSNSEISYYIVIEKRKFNKTDFFIYSSSQEYYTIQDLDTENIEEELIDISINGFEFNQVFHLTSNDLETEFESIVYSIQNGIEFIKKRNGNYLKINL